MPQYLVFIRLKGNRTKRLKDHIVPRRIIADNVDEAVRKATEGELLKEEGFEIVSVENS